MTDRPRPELPPATPPSPPDCIPAEWESEVLEDHVAEIIFDPYSSYQPDCVLCRRAADAGLFDIFAGPPAAGRTPRSAPVTDPVLDGTRSDRARPGGPQP
jgi:hypothetical protein